MRAAAFDLGDGVGLPTVHATDITIGVMVAIALVIGFVANPIA